MAEITLNYLQKPNSRPTTSGWNYFDVDFSVPYVFSLADFTSETNPPYSDPEGDELNSVKIVSLPIRGKIQLNSVDISLDDEILSQDIDSGLLRFVANPDYAGYSDSACRFLVSDKGSLEFNNSSNDLVFSISANENSGPNGIGVITIQINNPSTYVFTVENFTTETTPVYSDPEGNDAHEVKIDSLPIYGNLMYKGDSVGVGESFLLSEIELNSLTYEISEIQDADSSFEFSVSDESSRVFLEGGIVNFDVSDFVTSIGEFIYGMNAINLSSGGSAYYDSDLEKFTEDFLDLTNKPVTFSGQDEYVYFSYPSNFGLLTSIEDSNGFVVTDSFFIYTVDVVSSSTIEYNIYRSKSPTTINGLTYNFYF